MSVLNQVKRLFPQVERVVDAKESIAINVSKADNAAGRKKDSTHCALAQACKRQKIADAAIIGLAISYLVKGTTATRYKTSVSVAREITSFDRHHDFAEGRNYVLGKVHKGARIGAKHRGGKANGRMSKRKSIVHRTEFVRKLSD